MAELLSLGFMQRALLAGAIIGVISPMIGVFLVMRRMSVFGDALAHVTVAGVAAGLLARIDPVIMGIAAAAGASLGIESLRQRYQKYSELAVAITLSAALGLAVVLMSLNKTARIDPMTYLFGSIVTISPIDVWSIAILGLVTVAVIFLLYKELFFLAFDEELARISGLPNRGLNLALTALTGLNVALGMRVVGALLVSALMIIPVATAMQIGRSFRMVLGVSVLCSLSSVLVGLLIASYLDLPTGGTVVLVAVSLLLVVIQGKRMLRSA